MSMDAIGQLNWLAVIVGAVVYYVLGALIYAPPVLGRAWQRSIGWDTEAPAPGMSPTMIVIPVIANLVISTVIAMLAVATGTTDLAGGLTLGVVLGVGFSVGRTALDAVFDPMKPRPWTWFAITSLYHFVAVVVVAVIVSVWV